MAGEPQTGDTTTTTERNVDVGAFDGRDTNEYLVRIGGVSAILGSIVTFLALMVRPRSDPADPVQQTLRSYAAEIAAFDVHALGLFVGLLLLLGGFVGLEESVGNESGAPAAWGRLGLVAAVVMTTMGVILTILDAGVTPRLARAWVEAPAAEEAAALGAAKAVYTVHIVMVSRLHTLMALTFLLFGIAVWQSNAYHRLLGWSGVALGAIGVLLGMLAQFQGIAPRPARLRVGFALIVLFGWFLIVGVSLWRTGGATMEIDSSS